MDAGRSARKKERKRFLIFLENGMIVKKALLLIPIY
jgi:hypothetical protein